MRRTVWRDVADLDAREINRWGGFRADTAAMLETYGPSDYPVDGCSWRVNAEGTAAEVIYAFGDKHVSHTIRFARHDRPNRGWQIFFCCPICGSRRLRLALLEHGVACRGCAGIAQTEVGSAPITRLAYKAHKIAVRLGVEDWTVPVVRKPEGMSVKDYTALMLRRHLVINEIGKRLATRKLARGSTADIRNEYLHLVHGYR